MTEPDDIAGVLARELEYHERLYSGSAQRNFARPAIRAFRSHLVSHILRLTGAGPDSRVLSIGCGIGDTEIIMAPRIRQVVGIDLSPAAIRQARADAGRAGLHNIRFVEGTLDSADLPHEDYDLVIGIFFLHHLPDAALAETPRRIARLLRAGGQFYGLDPSRRRLSGTIGSLLIPSVMKKYQSPDERQLDGAEVAALFRKAGFACRPGFYDFMSTPLAGLFPGWRAGYQCARVLDDVLVRVPVLRQLGSNVQIVARKQNSG